MPDVDWFKVNHIVVCRNLVCGSNHNNTIGRFWNMFPCIRNEKSRPDNNCLGVALITMWVQLERSWERLSVVTILVNARSAVQGQHSFKVIDIRQEKNIMMFEYWVSICRRMLDIWCTYLKSNHILKNISNCIRPLNILQSKWIHSFELRLNIICFLFWFWWTRL